MSELRMTRRQSLRTPIVSLLLVVAFITSGTVLAENVLAKTPTAPPKTQEQLFLQHIKHVIVVVMENHAFDSEFGSYCSTTGPYCPTAVDGTPAGTCVVKNVAKPQNGCVRPFSFTAKNDSPGQALLHTYNSSIGSWNNGGMNGFYKAEGSGDTPFGEYNGTTIPLMWDFAEEYGLADDYFSSTLSYSLPTHWSYVSGGNGPAETVLYGLGDKTGGYAPAGVRSTYLQEAKNTTSVEDLLDQTKTSWKYYEFPLGNWTTASNTSQIGGPSTENAFNYWNPQAAKEESYSSTLTTHFVANQYFFKAAASGNLPQLSWVIPYFRYSEHPSANITLGDQWLASLVDTVEASPDWNTTALFVTYDEYGGFYDNVDPPVVNGTQLGFRIPLIVISPYTHPGTVVSSVLDPWSVLQAFEDVGHLGCMATLDCYAPSLLGFFNFTAPPRPPMLFPQNDTEAIYPMAVQPANATWQPLSGYQTPSYILDGDGESTGFVD